MREFRMATHYPRVELQAVIANSLVAGVLESQLDAESAASLFKSGKDRDSYWNESIAKFKNRTTLKPGATLALPLGAKFTGFTPNRPNSAFSDFMESVLRNIAAGLNMPYELLTKDFTKTNYSSARAALLEGWRYFNSRRTWIEENWLNPIYGLWLEEAVNAGQVDAPGFYDNRYAWSATRKWTMTGRGWVDPAKEATGAEKRMGARISSLASEYQEQGTDWRDVIDEIKIIEAYAKEQGVELYAKGLAGSPQEQIDLAESNADGSTDQQDAQDDVDQQDQQDQAA
jgi:lambda family phage portal protein